MTRNGRWLQALAALSLVAVVGCDEKLVTLNDEGLDQAEAAELGSRLINSLTDLAETRLAGISTNEGLSATEGPATISADRLELAWDQESPCSPSGSVAVNGMIDAGYDPQTEEADVSIQAVVTHDACVHPGPERTFTLSGSPSITFTADLHAVGGQPVGEQTVALQGGFAWDDDDGRGGVCEIDVVASVSADGKTRTFNGGFCGHTLNVEAVQS